MIKYFHRVVGIKMYYNVSSQMCKYKLAYNVMRQYWECIMHCCSYRVLTECIDLYTCMLMRVDIRLYNVGYFGIHWNML